MKKIGIYLMVLLVFCTNMPAMAASNGDFSNFVSVNTYNSDTFKDFASTDWYSQYIQYAYECGIINGKGNNEFDPSGDLTIAEAITLASKLRKIYYGEELVFESTGSNWYDGIVQYAKEENIIGNEFDGGYNNKANRAQMIRIFGGALPGEGFEHINEPFDIPDVNYSTAFSDYIQMFYNCGIVNGSDSEGTFNPYSNISRAEAATIISRVAQPSTRTIREAVVDDVEDETTVDQEEDNSAEVSWEVGYQKVQVGKSIDGSAIYREVYQGATLVKKGTLVAEGIRTTEDFYVRFGSHTYGSKTQAEYDAVVSVMEEAAGNIDFKSAKDVPVYNSHLKPYAEGTLDGEGVAYLEGIFDEWQLALLEDGDFDGFSKSAYVTAFRTNMMNLKSKYKNTDVTGSDESAYDYMFGNLEGECNGRSQTDLLVMDYIGYNGAIVYTTGHAVCYASVPEVYGNDWIDMESGEPNAANMGVFKGFVVKPTKDLDGITAGDYYNRSADVGDILK